MCLKKSALIMSSDGAREKKKRYKERSMNTARAAFMMNTINNVRIISP